MSALTTAPLALEEYLHNPEYERYEYVDGQAVAINVGSKKHGRIQFRISRYLDSYLEQNPIGYGAAELRCRIGKRFRLPDICIVFGDESPDSEYLDRSPDFVIEIRSPDDTMAFMVRKMEEYLGAGTKLGWLILPEERSVLVFSPGRTPHAAVMGESLDGGDVLPGLTLALGQIFPN
jgi:Uma2 family endonuclease